MCLDVFLVGGGLCLAFLVLKWLFGGEPDRTITHRKDILGRRVTDIEDRGKGRREKRVKDRNIWGDKVTKVYVTKKCRTCGANVSRSGDGRFHCCGRSWR